MHIDTPKETREEELPRDIILHSFTRALWDTDLYGREVSSLAAFIARFQISEQELASAPIQSAVSEVMKRRVFRQDLQGLDKLLGIFNLAPDLRANLVESALIRCLDQRAHGGVLYYLETMKRYDLPLRDPLKEAFKKSAQEDERWEPRELKEICTLLQLSRAEILAVVKTNFLLKLKTYQRLCIDLIEEYIRVFELTPDFFDVDIQRTHILRQIDSAYETEFSAEVCLSHYAVSPIALEEAIIQYGTEAGQAGLDYLERGNPVGTIFGDALKAVLAKQSFPTFERRELPSF